MANKLQKTFYDMTNLIPIFLIEAVALFINSKWLWFSYTLVMISIFTCAIFFVFFFTLRKKITKVNIRVSGLESKDSWILMYLITYLIPVIGIFFSENSIWLFAVIILLAIVLTSNLYTPNIFLYAIGYHFYNVESEDTGIKDYLLITRQKTIRNKSSIVAVQRMYEKTLIV